MRICIDRNQFIFGISGVDAASESILRLLPRLEVILPRIVLKEVTRNLRETEVDLLYQLLHRASLTIIDEPVPAELVRSMLI